MLSEVSEVRKVSKIRLGFEKLKKLQFFLKNRGINSKN